MAGVSTVTGFAANVSRTVLSGLWIKAVQVVKMVISMPQAVKMVISMPQAVADMEAQAQRLDIIIHDTILKLDQEQKPPQRIVKAWLEKADEAIKSSRFISNEYQQHKNCLSCCLNCFYRYKISKRIIDWKVNVDRLHTERQSDFPASGKCGDPTQRTQIPIQTPNFFGNGIQVAQSELERWLTEDTSVRLIGVYGMGGVGKTSLLQTINNSYKVRQSFELIIWVTVSKDYDILNLQNFIADRLNVKLPEVIDKSNLEERNHVLCSCLKGKRYLLILDDLWKSLDLQSLGVSLNDTASKIVLSTRRIDVCTQMRVDKTTSVEPLLEEEGWQLFCSRAFRNGNVPREMEDVARKIAGECKGLPLAINVIAAAMLNHSYQHEWENALQQLQNLDEIFYDLHDENEESVFQRLKWSYNVLPDYLKTCFVYFAAYPKDRVIEVAEVIDIWVAEGLVKGSGESYLPDTAHSFINLLRNRCLIEVVENDAVGRIQFVKIHDVLRDLAIRIAEEQHMCYFKAGYGVSQFPIEEVIDNACARIILVYNRLQSRPSTFACASLSVLLLTGNRGIKDVVPKSFLRELSSLKVLDLSRTGITSLPPWIGNLKHLASLQLYNCQNIRELLETICDLKDLQFLNVSGCKQLLCLPERISELKRLRALDISYCESLSHLPRGISELVSLERLTMWNSGVQLDFEEANAERKYGCLKDLESLRRLRVLQVQIKSPIKEGLMGNWSKMRDLSLYFKDANQDYLPQDMQAMKDLERLYLSRCDVERLPSWVSDFRKLAYLQLYNCKQLKELPAELPCLRVLRIEGCDKLEALQLGMGFPKLQELTLSNLESLECVGASPFLSMLKSLTLTVLDCPKLKRWLWLSTMQQPNHWDASAIDQIHCSSLPMHRLHGG